MKLKRGATLKEFFINWRRRQELGMILLSSLVVSSAYIVVSLAKSAKVPANLSIFLGIVILLALTAHIAIRWLAPRADSVIIPIVCLLNGLGYVIIARLDVALAKPFAPYQAAWTAIGILVFVLTLFVVKNLRDLDRYRYLMGVVGFFLLISPLVPKLGYRENGALLWIHLGSFTFQPVEIAKICFVIFFASYLSQNKELLSTRTVKLGRVLVPDLRALAPIALAWLFSMGVMGLEDDIGFALMFFVVFISMVWLATGRYSYLVLGAILFVGAMFIGYHLFPQVAERMTAWRNPFKYPNTIGYQPIQSMVAMGLGGLGGTGLGLGHPSFIPVANSDFIYAVIGEELGLFGTTAIAIAFLILIGSGLRVAIAARSEFIKLLTAGLTLMLGFQAFFIMAGIVRLLPLTGITLPFVSYGGSSLVANYILIALLMKASDEANNKELLKSYIASFAG